MVTASTPAARTASKAATGARKWYCLGSSVPRSVIAVSRLTIAKSADDRTVAIGPNAVAGLVSSGAVRPVKCTSPANASVHGPAGSGDPTADGTGDGDGGGWWNVADAGEVQPASAAANNNASARGDLTATG